MCFRFLIIAGLIALSPPLAYAAERNSVPVAEVAGSHFADQGNCVSGTANSNELSARSCPGTSDAMLSINYPGHSTECVYIDNSSVKSFFVPLRLLAEWMAFKENHPQSVNIVYGCLATSLTDACGRAVTLPNDRNQAIVTIDHANGAAHYRCDATAACGTWTQVETTLTCSVPGACGAANGAQTAVPPSVGQLCSTGSPTSIVQGANNVFSWTCQGADGSGDTMCATAAISPQDGACGADNGRQITSAPSSLCSQGSASNMISGPNSFYSWNCQGDSGGATASCATVPVNPQDGVCGVANHTQITAAPMDGLCNQGAASQMISLANNVYNWTCVGSNGGATDTCSTLPIETLPPPPQNNCTADPRVCQAYMDTMRRLPDSGGAAYYQTMISLLLAQQPSLSYDDLVLAVSNAIRHTLNTSQAGVVIQGVASGPYGIQECTGDFNCMALPMMSPADLQDDLALAGYAGPNASDALIDASITALNSSRDNPNSPQAIHDQNQATVVGFYQNIVGHQPTDPANYAYWTNQLDAGVPVSQVEQGFRDACAQLGGCTGTGANQ